MTVYCDVKTRFLFDCRYLIESLDNSYFKTEDIEENTLSPFQKIFRGQFTQQSIAMPCGHIFIKSQYFKDICVDISRSNTVEAALTRFFSSEVINYTCSQCGLKGTAKQQLYIQQAPPVICVQFKRFDQVDKICDPIMVPLNLDINPFMKNGTRKEENYTLRSMINHIGSSATQGHYTAIAEANGQFILYNDANVPMSITTENALKSAKTSYILIYENNSVQMPKQTYISAPMAIPRNSAGVPIKIPPIVTTLPNSSGPSVKKSKNLIIFI